MPGMAQEGKDTPVMSRGADIKQFFNYFLCFPKSLKHCLFAKSYIYIW